MAIFFDAPVEPDDLTTFVREIPVPPQLTLSALMPTRQVQDNQVDWAEITHTNRTARFRSWDGRIHVSSRDTGSTKLVKLPPLSSSLNMGEYERLQLQFARLNGGNQGALANAVYNDAQNLVGEIRNRIEMAWGDVLTDGILSINENGLVSTADFGVPGGHKVTAGTPWTTVASAPALTNLIAWMDVYVATNGFAPGSIRTSQRVIRLMCRNAEIIAAAYGSTTGRTQVTLADLNAVLASNGLPSVGDPIDTQLDVDGAATRTIPDDRLLFLPPNIGDLGYTAYGVTATALELVNSNESDLSFADAPGIVGVVEKVGPPYRQFTFVDACAMPVLTNAKLLFIADVA